MTILITNDDGVDSPGIIALTEAVRAAKPEASVCVVAPAAQQSGMSHGITLSGPVRVREIADGTFAAWGTPADCVLVAVLDILPEHPSIVLSGVNIGPNIGTDLIFSGTAAAARQAALLGIPGVAISLYGYEEPLHFSPVCEFVARNLDLLRSTWSSDHFININAPNLPDPAPPASIGRPAARGYDDRLEHFHSPNGDRYYFLTGRPAKADVDEQADLSLLNRGEICVSPILVQPTNSIEESRYREVRFR